MDSIYESLGPRGFGVSTTSGRASKGEMKSRQEMVYVREG